VPEGDSEVVPGSQSPALTDPGSQSSSANSQPLDPEAEAAARYAAKGKGKVPGSLRDVGNVAQRELQLAERSLDLWI